MRLREILIAAIVLLAPAAASAHPHVWVDSASEVVFDDKGRIAAIRHHWLFDEEFSAYALQGLDTNRDGKYSPEELAPLAKENVESLKDFDFFTSLFVGDYDAGFAAPTHYYLELMNNRLLLHFTLPLAVPLLTRGTAHLEVDDPDYFVAFTLPNANAVRLVNAPPACRIVVHPGHEPDPAAAAQLATIGADQRALPPGMQALTAGTENSADVNCGLAPAAPSTAGGAVSAMAGGTAAGGDLTALPPASTDVTESSEGESADAQTPPAPAGSSPVPSSPSSASSTAPPAPESVSAPSVSGTPLAIPGSERSLFGYGPWMGWLVAVQTEFNRQLTAGLKGLKAGGGFFWLGSISFLYGIVHAAGPGHGKMVISTYLVANEARLRRGLVIAFISAFVQAVVAVAIIGLMAVILNMTSLAITSAANAFEAGSFALVALLGLYLLARKGRAAWSAMKGGDPHAHHHHHHHGLDADHDHHHGPALAASAAHGGSVGAAETDHHHGHRHDVGCGHSHIPAPGKAKLAKPGLGGAAAAIASVGIRPCSGALVVLVFALSQGIFWAGVASTFVMALGTAMTVAALAALAVGAKGIARKLAAGDDRRGGQLMLGLELAAALFITLMGTVLFLGSLYA